MSTDVCTSCRKPCAPYNPATAAERQHGDTVALLSTCCGAPVRLAGHAHIEHESGQVESGNISPGLARDGVVAVPALLSDEAGR